MSFGGSPWFILEFPGGRGKVLALLRRGLYDTLKRLPPNTNAWPDSHLGRVLRAADECGFVAAIM